MQSAIVGSGYVGLVSGACFAEIGHELVCVDRDGTRIGTLRQGVVPIFESGLDTMVGCNVAQRRLSFTASLTVSSPPGRNDGHADLSQVHAAAREIAAALHGSRSSS
jgi:UDPglucose 6-dehydrogenase